MSRSLYFLLSWFLVSVAYSQTTLKYTVTPHNLEHHEISIVLTVEKADYDSINITMPNSSPGRYAFHSFAKNIYEEHATNKQGQHVNLKKTTPYSWKVPVSDGFAKFQYTLYANHADGTYSGVDTKKLHLNIPSSFVYVDEFPETEIEITFDMTEHEDWKIASQLPMKGPSTLTAPNYYYFYDSPILVGDIKFIDWEVDGQTIEIALMHEGNGKELESYAEWVKALVLEQKAVFGELPKYDYGKYTFLCSYNPWVFGDAMEHRNSTICTSKGNLAQHAPYMIGSIAHEFIHCWNIERIRPASLEPFDFDHTNLSGELWFGEGFTNYYDELTQCRAGIIDETQFLKTMTGVINKVKNSPGREIRNPIQMSQNAPFVDAATAIDETNYANNFISYYTYGEFLGLALDLSIRTKFDGLCLDDLMKYMWQNFGKTEIPYEIDDLQEALSQVTGDEVFAQSFFDQYIYSSQFPDMKTLLSKVGINIQEVAPEKIHIGNVQVDKNGLVRNSTLRGTALYEAGIDKGDRILSISGKEISEELDFETIVEELVPGKYYAITFEQMNEVKSSKFLAKPNPTVILKTNPEASDNALKARQMWLQSAINEKSATTGR